MTCLPALEVLIACPLLLANCLPAWELLTAWGAMLVAWGEALPAHRKLALTAGSVLADQVIFPSFFFGTSLLNLLICFLQLLGI